MPLALPPPILARVPARERPAIIGGTTASIQTLPWLTFVSGQFADGTGESCSGTVLAARIVLTAGHCAEDPTTGARYPAGDLRVTTGATDVADGGGQASAVTRVIIDPAYDPPDEADDAALLVLTSPSPAPAITLSSSDPAAGTAAIVAGWGQTSAGGDAIPTVLRTAPADVLDPADCATVWDSSFDPASELCTLDQGPQSAGACRGDSGGPLLADQDGSPVELGLTIFVATDCATTLPDVYTAAAAIAPWVAAELPTLTASAPGTPLAADGASARTAAAAHQAAAASRAALVRAARHAAVTTGRRTRRWLSR